MNVIVKFVENPKKKNQLVAFYNKKVCLIHPDGQKLIKPDENWECFVWAEHDKYLVLKPFGKIEESNLNDELKRVEDFNASLAKMEITLKKHPEYFEKIVFSKENKPYLRSVVPPGKVKDKFSDFIVRKMELKNGEMAIVARPIITPEDRVEWRQNP